MTRATGRRKPCRRSMQNQSRQHQVKALSSEQQQYDQQGPAISILLHVDKRFCKAAGGLIHGKISMFVPQSAAGCDDFSGIHLSLEGYETIELQRESPPDTSLEFSDDLSLWQKCRKRVARISTQVAPLSSPLVAGQFEYPFWWQLPTDKILPISMSCSSTDASTCKIHYNLTAYVATKTFEPSRCKAIPSRKPICITGSGKIVIDRDSDAGSNTMMVEPKTCRVKSWFGTKGFVEIGLDTVTKDASTNSIIAVSITGRGNLSCIPVKELCIEWIETVRWGTKPEEERERSRILAQTTVSVRNLPQWKKQTKSKLYIPGSTAEADSINENLITAYLPLNISAKDSYQGGLIKVQHAIHVTAITRGQHVTNPKFTTPIIVHQKQLQQLNFGARSVPTPPIMAQAKLSSNDDIDINDSHHLHHENETRQNIKIPQAFPVEIDRPIEFYYAKVMQGGMQQQQQCCCSNENAVACLGSAAQSSVAHRHFLEPAFVLTVE